MGIAVFQPKLSCDVQEEDQSLPFSGKDQIMTAFLSREEIKICFVFIGIPL